MYETRLEIELGTLIFHFKPLYIAQFAHLEEENRKMKDARKIND